MRSILPDSRLGPDLIFAFWIDLTSDPGGATWFQFYPDVCVEKGRTWVLFQLQVSEMSGMISLKMGIKFATSLNMGGKLPPKLYIIT